MSAIARFAARFAAPALVLVSCAAPQGALAQILETRRGEANPMVSVFKSTLYGGAAGLVLGLAVELVDDDGNADAVKWGFVSGAFFGFGYGLYHVSTRPEPHSLLERRPGGRWALALPRPEPAGPVLAARGAPSAPPAPGARFHLVALRF